MSNSNQQQEQINELDEKKLLKNLFQFGNNKSLFIRVCFRFEASCQVFLKLRWNQELSWHQHAKITKNNGENIHRFEVAHGEIKDTEQAPIP
jgi:hypothetical protein